MPENKPTWMIFKQGEDHISIHGV